MFRLSGGKEVKLEVGSQSGTSPVVVTIPDVGATGVANLITDKDSGTITSAMIAAETIVNDDISLTAAIAGTKISPNFGSQAISTTGSLAAASATLSGLSTAGVVHNSAAGALSTSKIVNADVDDAAGITDGKLATISTAGKVANSATTATDANTVGAIVARDGSGNFSAGAITATSFNGPLTSSAISGATSVSYAVTTANADSTITPAADRPVILLNNTVSTTINSVANPAAGKQVFLINDGLVDLTINDNNGGSTGIFTGTGSPFTLKTNASVSLLYNSSQSRWVLSGGAGGSGSGGTVLLVGQSSTGLVVGDVMYVNGTNFTKASAAAANTAEVVGVVSNIIDASSYEVTLTGLVEKAGWGLTPGEVYFLSATTSGAITVTEPSTIGQVSVPIGVAQTSTQLIVSPKRGVVVGGTNARTELTLASASTTNIFNAQTPTLYQAGELTGWVQLGTSQKFYFRAPFAQNGAGTNWNISPSYVGDTPPAGFSLQMSSAGVISITCPTFAGTGLVNYALNAPAVGATFPLEISAARITQDTIAAARLPVADASNSGIVSTSAQTFAGAKTFTGAIIPVGGISIQSGQQLIQTGTVAVTASSGPSGGYYYNRYAITFSSAYAATPNMSFSLTYGGFLPVNAARNVVFLESTQTQSGTVVTVTFVSTTSGDSATLNWIAVGNKA